MQVLSGNVVLLPIIPMIERITCVHLQALRKKRKELEAKQLKRNSERKAARQAAPTQQSASEDDDDEEYEDDSE